MNPRIIDGRAVREALVPALRARVAALISAPTIAIIQVGNRPDSNSYIRGKKLFAQKVGIKETHIQVSEDISQKELIELVRRYNADPSVQGIIVQLPLPLHLDRDTVINAIDPLKDVDALTAVNVQKWLDGSGDALLPATARAVRELLQYYQINIMGKHVVVIGRSDLVGRPIAAMCLNEGATVTVCHSKTPDLIAETKEADILIVAIGKPQYIRAEHIKKGAVVIDVGINTIHGQKLDDEPESAQSPKEKLVGDVDFQSVQHLVSAITPVPGGVGPMTVFSLFENLVDLCTMSR